jgi:hypothetical protein
MAASAGHRWRSSRPGNYRLNPFLFSVQLTDAVDIPDNKVGIVTTREGASLPAGEIAGPSVSGHDMFQNPQGFIDAKGCKGLQEQVLLAGRYFINPRFATVELVDMTEVPIAHVGVVIAFVGREGKDVSMAISSPRVRRACGSNRSIQAAVSPWRAPKEGVRTAVRAYSIVVAVNLLIATAYLAYWGIIGWRTWA